MIILDPTPDEAAVTTPAAETTSATENATATAPKKNGCGCGGHKAPQGGIVINFDGILIKLFVLWLLTFLILKIFE